MEEIMLSMRKMKVKGLSDLNTIQIPSLNEGEKVDFKEKKYKKYLIQYLYEMNTSSGTISVVNSYCIIPIKLDSDILSAVKLSDDGTGKFRRFKKNKIISIFEVE